MKNNYRIKKITTPCGFERYYPQQKILWLFWVNMFGDSGWFDSYQRANDEPHINPALAEVLRAVVDELSYYLFLPGNDCRVIDASVMYKIANELEAK